MTTRPLDGKTNAEREDEDKGHAKDSKRIQTQRGRKKNKAGRQRKRSQCRKTRHSRFAHIHTLCFFLPVPAPRSTLLRSSPSLAPSLPLFLAHLSFFPTTVPRLVERVVGASRIHCSGPQRT